MGVFTALGAACGAGAGGGFCGAACAYAGEAGPPTSVAARISAISGRANSVAPDAARVLRSEVIALLTLVIPPRDLNLNLKGSICKTFTQWNLFREGKERYDFTKIGRAHV